MPRIPMLVAGAIPAIVAILIVIPLFTTDRVPPTTLLPTDTLEFKYTQHLVVAASGMPARGSALESSVLEIDDSGSATLIVVGGGEAYESDAQVDDESLHRLRALIKETGFMEITPMTFLPDVQPPEYELYALSVVLNGDQKNVRWSSNDTKTNFVPPIIVTIQEELDAIQSMMR